jgi:hypothetical protein
MPRFDSKPRAQLIKVRAVQPRDTSRGCDIAAAFSQALTQEGGIGCGPVLIERTRAVHGACTPLTVTVTEPGLPGVDGVAGVGGVLTTVIAPEVPARLSTHGLVVGVLQPQAVTA